MPVPDFSVGEVFTASAADSIGMWKIAQTTITTGTTTVEMANVFSSNYTNYRLVIDNASAANTGSLALYFGTTLPSTGYFSSMYYDGSQGTAASARTNNQGFIFLMLVDSNKSGGSFDIQNPQKANWTTVHGTAFGRGTFMCVTGGAERANTQHTTLRIINDQGGNITGGTFTLYGYRN